MLPFFHTTLRCGPRRPTMNRFNPGGLDCKRGLTRGHVTEGAMPYGRRSALFERLVKLILLPHPQYSVMLLAFRQYAQPNFPLRGSSMHILLHLLAAAG